MDGETLQLRVRSGYEKAARRVGMAYFRHRPTSALGPYTGTPIEIQASFAASGNSFNFEKGQEPGEHLFNVLADPANLAPGDYFVRGDVWVYLIARVPVLAPPTAILCNTLVTVTRAAAPVTGLSPYSGDIRGVDTTILAGYPTRVKLARASGPVVDLPSDGMQSQVDFWLPAIAPVRSGDIATDSSGRRYVIGAVELDGSLYIVKAKGVAG
jgi:hypothetical protein